MPGTSLEAWQGNAKGPHMRWLQTDFARYVLCPESAVEGWTGQEAIAAVPDYLSVIEHPSLGGLLCMSGEPMPIAYDESSRTFIRWDYADSEDAAAEALQKAEQSAAWTTGPMVHIPNEPVVLFDCGYAGSDVTPDNSCSIHLPQGRYLVRSLEMEISDSAAFRLDRLVPVTEGQGQAWSGVLQRINLASPVRG
ncbi:Imm21 family immunity protein [Streptomyces sp. NPDC014776]|uniref:Imm21 family immunity protein n=1 Tax=Streptomyces sp. NPDC014776 TaxID=3364909 RepID=UPI0037003F5D